MGIKDFGNISLWKDKKKVELIISRINKAIFKVDKYFADNKPLVKSWMNAIIMSADLFN